MQYNPIFVAHATAADANAVGGREAQRLPAMWRRRSTGLPSHRPCRIANLNSVSDRTSTSGPTIFEPRQPKASELPELSDQSSSGGVEVESRADRHRVDDTWLSTSAKADWSPRLSVVMTLSEPSDSRITAPTPLRLPCPDARIACRTSA